MNEVSESRLAYVMKKGLSHGSHLGLNVKNDMCAMEAVAYVAGEKWTDEPKCACPVVSEFLRSWNDSLNDADRNALLKPLIASLIGSKSTEEVEKQRGYLSLDWLIRVFTPKWFDLVPTLHKHANALRGLDAIFNIGSAKTAVSIVRAAGDAAWTAAGDAARTAAPNAAVSAAQTAARTAAVAAARTSAWDEAGNAAGNAAWDAAVNAARAATGADTSQTVATLQISAVDLIHRMLAIKT